MNISHNGREKDHWTKNEVFRSRFFSVNVTKSAGYCGFGHTMENFIFCAIYEVK